MTSRDFCYWLQGLFELSECDDNKASAHRTLSLQQVAVIKRHLQMVFAHEIDPSMGGPAHQALLTQLHEQPTGQGGASSGRPDGALIRC